ncbi:glycoside hydrolase family 30 protein [Flavobacterium sp.]|uniref:glycoside hydrolase family 30 protein n=1 Tax=Flavobacterium sp. TaxID=239 RepID=UPI003266F3A6
MKKIGFIITCLCFCIACYSQQKIKKQIQEFSKKNKNITVYTTADNTKLRLTPTDNLSFTPSKQPIETEISVFVEPSKKFQTFMGIGGAITDASAEIFDGLSKEKQTEFLNAYYDKQKGIGYSLLRTTIQSSDFSSGSYSYIEEGDKDLKTFSVEHDKQYRIPLIKQAIATAGGKLTTYVAPWSPNAFMKSNKNVLKGGTLLPEYYQTWANFYTKFIKAYEKEGIPIWGTSTQNEPMAVQTWESCIYTAEDERDFIKNFLGPTLKKEKLGDVKIIAWDHNRDLMNQRANVIYSDPEAYKYVWGMGFHWYETWSGGLPMFENVRKVHEAYPDKGLLFTEGCVERFDASKYQFWPNAERYGISMINDFNNGTTGWTDWNILLDQNGGPNHVGNFCFAPIHADTTTGELIYTPSYYYIGHFSKFIHLDAVRVSSAVSRSNLLSTSFLNTDGTIATIVMNQTDTEIAYSLIIDFEKTTVKIPPHAIQTLVY